ncbi:MAG: xanthine dehydrogenase family protein molybdopterin-binding subunit, partial [Lachnospiraceae bacterium]
PNIGYGIAGGHLSCGLGKNIPDDAKVEIIEQSPGKYDIHVGFVDIGQGSATALQALAADALETKIENVNMVMADTDKSFDCGSTAGSRSTYVAGNAILNAVKNYKKLKESGEIRATGEASFPEANKSYATPGFPHAMYTFIAQAVKLKLNPVTGAIELLDIFAATEAGRVINPLSLAGQMQGGIVMSIGYALMENCLFQEDGSLRNRDLSTYLLPTAMDVPAINSIHVEAYEESGPAGVKGAAEVATVSIAPAIGNAIYEISGVSPNALPFDKYTTLKALARKRNDSLGKARRKE